MSDQIMDQPQESATLEAHISFDEFMQRYEGQPYEWHAGKVVKKVANNERHAIIFNFVHILLSLYISLRQLGRVYPDGYQMYISDDLPARQPDLMIVFNEHFGYIKHQRLEGPADIVVEIVSPSSATIDRGEKLIEYEQAGVREYWLIDPMREEAVIYALHEDGRYRRVPLSGESVLVSTLLPNFALETTLLWRETPPEGQELLDLVHAMTV